VTLFDWRLKKSAFPLDREWRAHYVANLIKQSQAVNRTIFKDSKALSPSKRRFSVSSKKSSVFGGIKPTNPVMQHNNIFKNRVAVTTSVAFAWFAYQNYSSEFFLRSTENYFFLFAYLQHIYIYTFWCFFSANLALGIDQKCINWIILSDQTRPRVPAALNRVIQPRTSPRLDSHRPLKYKFHIQRKHTKAVKTRVLHLKTKKSSVYLTVRVHIYNAITPILFLNFPWVNSRSHLPLLWRQ
jgi:hypothetical protein